MKKVLYIEDNEINQILFQASLEDMVDLEMAENGNDGINLANKEKFDLIVIDLNLNDPMMDGFDVLKRLKKDYKSEKNTVFYAYSSYSGEEWEKKCKEAGFDAFFSKPTPAPKLLEHYEQQFN